MMVDGGTRGDEVLIGWILGGRVQKSGGGWARCVYIYSVADSCRGARLSMAKAHKILQVSVIFSSKSLYIHQPHYCHVSQYIFLYFWGVEKFFRGMKSI